MRPAPAGATTCTGTSRVSPGGRSAGSVVRRAFGSSTRFPPLSHRYARRISGRASRPQRQTTSLSFVTRYVDRVLAAGPHRRRSGGDGKRRAVERLRVGRPDPASVHLGGGDVDDWRAGHACGGARERERRLDRIAIFRRNREELEIGMELRQIQTRVVGEPFEAHAGTLSLVRGRLQPALRGRVENGVEMPERCLHVRARAMAHDRPVEDVGKLQ